MAEYAALCDVHEALENCGPKAEDRGRVRRRLARDLPDAYEIYILADMEP